MAKDGLIKVWDLDLQHCIETAAPGDGELWSLSASSSEELPKSELDASRYPYVLVTGGSEGQIRVWACCIEQQTTEATEGSSSSKPAATDAVPVVRMEPQGTLQHGLTKRITQIGFEPLPPSDGAEARRPEMRRLACLTSDRTFQSFFFRSSQDIRSKMARRAKRAREKDAAKGASGPNKEAPAAGSEPLALLEQVEVGDVVRAQDGRFRAFSFATGTSQDSAPLVLFSLSSNALEVQKLPAKAKKSKSGGENGHSEAKSGPIHTLDLPGHRSDVRAIAISHSGDLVASACSAGQVKVWNLATGLCLRTMSGGYALSMLWLADDSHILVGCKDGTIRSYELSSGNELDAVNAHDGPVWSIALRPDGQGFVSGSADKTAKFWDFDYESSDDEDEDDTDAQAARASGTRHLTLVHTKTLKMTDDILAIACSPDGRLIALSLLDSTVKVFFSDTLKFFLSLYGHKLPALSIDISHDSKLIITGSADKNVKIWGLDFGDCHRSLIAHSDSVMSVRFEGGQQGGGLMGGREGISHRFWSVGKDGLVKYWDGDKFEVIQSLRGHHGEVWALSTDREGKQVVTAGADRSIRLWEKTDEPLFLEEERERELEAVYQNAGGDRNDDELAIGALADSGAKADGQEPTNEATEVAATSQRSMTAAERLIEAIEVADIDIRDQAQPLPPPRSALLLAGLRDKDEQTAARFVFRTVEGIPATQLTDVLLLLSFSAVTSLLKHVDTWLQKVGKTRGHCSSLDADFADIFSQDWSLTLSARVLFFLMRTHHAQIVSNSLLRNLLAQLRRSLRSALARQKVSLREAIAATSVSSADPQISRPTSSQDVLGYNLSALKFTQGQARVRKQAEFDIFAPTSTIAEGRDDGTSRPAKRKVQIM